MNLNIFLLKQKKIAKSILASVSTAYFPSAGLDKNNTCVSESWGQTSGPVLSAQRIPSGISWGLDVSIKTTIDMGHNRLKCQ